MSILLRKKSADGPRMDRLFILTNKLGMHARPAAMFVKTVCRYEADIFVEKDGEEVNGKSIMGLMMLAAGCGSRLKITADGGDAEKVLEEIGKLIERRFDEE